MKAYTYGMALLVAAAFAVVVVRPEWTSVALFALVGLLVLGLLVLDMRRDGERLSTLEWMVLDVAKAVDLMKGAQQAGEQRLSKLEEESRTMAQNLARQQAAPRPGGIRER